MSTKRFFSTLSVLSAAVLACSIGGGTPTETPPAATTTIGGTVWHDLCALPDGPLPEPPPQGCVVLPGGGAGANGFQEPGEPGIAGVEVKLLTGDCNSEDGTSTVTDSLGHYSFPNVAAPGVYCVSIDAGMAPNDGILIPGGWTSPATSEAAASVSFVLDENTLSVGSLDFGWDYQFLPPYTGAPAGASAKDEISIP
jgi:hypothetical protein